LSGQLNTGDRRKVLTDKVEDVLKDLHKSIADEHGFIRRRLNEADLDPVSLVGDLVRDKRILRKARMKILKDYVREADKTAAMRKTPRRVLAERTWRGEWDRFSVYPAVFEPRRVAAAGSASVRGDGQEPYPGHADGLRGKGHDRGDGTRSGEDRGGQGHHGFVLFVYTGRAARKPPLFSSFFPEKISGRVSTAGSRGSLGKRIQ